MTQAPLPNVIAQILTVVMLGVGITGIVRDWFKGD
jgi:hypothetical protein